MFSAAANISDSEHSLFLYLVLLFWIYLTIIARLLSNIKSMTLFAQSKLQFKASSLIIVVAKSSIFHFASICLFALPQLIELTDSCFSSPIYFHISEVYFASSLQVLWLHTTQKTYSLKSPSEFLALNILSILQEDFILILNTVCNKWESLFLC